MESAASTLMVPFIRYLSRLGKRLAVIVEAREATRVTTSEDETHEAGVYLGHPNTPDFAVSSIRAWSLIRYGGCPD